ncbi:hypothetical protein Sgly_0353 [Syntrophobotulus glycolicus DSM 8271]|uniref:Uncharacterized protein n=1 Tax=Syntrophobotulus glycolicus (strain DSM 8271 / FlGlyR) TaxID=645991 RepID=F0SXH3_SYNGF|nr:DUF6711 family protein [Syntrophobotulus glycolicus]ADY54719.1 hypothetical protein Sgly_0353 [Syntrophobotulus glycolicus DSM 8271]
MIKINSIELPALTDYIVSIMDISKAERNANGTVIIERIATKRKIELAFGLLTREQLSQVLNLVAPVFFTVEYVDPQDNAIKTGTFYCGDRSAGGLRYKNGRMSWKGIKFNLIER